MDKQRNSRILAVLLAVVMIVGMLPMGLFATVSAAGVSSYTVTLKGGESTLELDEIDITLTNKDDETQTMTQKTVKGVATFAEFVEEGMTYTLSVAEIVGYEKLEDVEITVGEGETNYDVLLNAIEKLTVSGKVTDDQGNAYAGATVNVTGYAETTAVTDAAGEYSVEVYKGKTVKLTVQPTEQDKEKYPVIEMEETVYNEAALNVNHAFALRTYTITLGAGENGEILLGDAPAGSSVEAKYDESKSFTIKAEDGYFISMVTVDDAEQTDAKGQQSYEVKLEQIKADHKISATFYQGYKVTFSVGANGEVSYGGETINGGTGGTVSAEKIFADSSVAVTATPNQEGNYRVSKVKIGDEEKTKLPAVGEPYSTTLSFAENKREICFEVEFSNQYAVSIGNVTGKGTIELKKADDEDSQSINVVHGEGISIRVTADEDYDLTALMANGTGITFSEVEGKKGVYTAVLEEITADTTITASFSEKDAVNDGDYSITYVPDKSAYVGGTTFVPKDTTVTIAPAGDTARVRVTVEKGTTKSVLTGDLTKKSVSVALGADDDKYERITAIEVSTNENVGGWKQNKVNITYDGTAPSIVKFDITPIEQSKTERVISFLTFGIFYKEQVNITVTAEDTGFGVDSITLFLNNQGTEKKIEVEKNSATFTVPANALENGTFTAAIRAKATDKVGNTTETAIGPMNVANDSGKLLSNDLTIEENPPTISFAEIKAPEGTNHYEKKITVEEPAKTETQNWYSGDVPFNITVKDADSGIQEIYATINDKPVEISGFTTGDRLSITPHTDENNKNHYYFNYGTEPTKSVSFQLNSNVLNEKSKNFEGKVEVKVFVVDNAGNENVGTCCVYIDRTMPKVTRFEFAPATAENETATPVKVDEATGETAALAEGEKPEAYVDSESHFMRFIDANGEPVDDTPDKAFGYYFQQNTNVTITVEDADPASGVKDISVYLYDVVEKQYYAIDEKNTCYEIDTIENVLAVNAAGEAEDNSKEKHVVTRVVTIPANFKGQIYAKATDNLDNSMPDYVTPNGVILETQKEHDNKEETHIAFDIPDAPYRTDGEIKDNTISDGNWLYKYGKDNNPDGIPVTITVTDTYAGIRSIEWSVTVLGDESGGQNEKITVNNDGTISEDDSGWTFTETDKDNNLITKLCKTIYVTNNSNNIMVEVQMTDRAGNVSVKSITFSIDNMAPTIEVAYDNNAAENDTYYNIDRTATITITERNFDPSKVSFKIENTDGVIPDVDLTDPSVWKHTEDNNVHTATIRYTADGDYTFEISCQDRAENGSNEVSHSFTIDKTLPTVSVVYDNNSAMNGNYYKADRTATITIREHNFDTSRVNVIGTATDDGKIVTFPTVSGWASVGGDTYVATIAYTADAKYTFDITCIDKAGNSIRDYALEEFYVDKTAPSLEITGVGDKTANNGDIIPVITYSDTNFDKNTVRITLTGVNNGEVKYAGAYENIRNGQTYTYENFKKEEKVDDIYTLTVKLTDKAGNETEKTITFSANRFGSVYDLSMLKDILGQYLQQEQDIVFTETNVDTLEQEGILLKLTTNGTPRDLVEGTDYTVKHEGGNGKWSVYTYTVNKELFEGDASYRLSVHSKDAAGNINENDDISKEAEINFVVDKTAPVVIPVDFKSGEQYPVEQKTVTVEIRDNFLIEGVKIYLDDKEIDYTVDDVTYTFVIPASNSVQTVRIVALDAAGNETPLMVEDFLVSTNIFARWYNNTPLFIGSIAGVAVVALGIAAYLVFGKKKKTGAKK